jgi:hypothetical protein
MRKAMIKFIRQIAACTMLFASLANIFPVQAQDRAIHRTLRFARDTSHADVNRRIARGTSHVYHFRARCGQYMAVFLKTGENTSLSVYSVKSGQIDNADGVTEWDGTLPDTGEYVIEIGTDRTAVYSLMVSIENP